ncbi:DUF1080 domain-containing protein [Puteibacter caeruleilacunae]|nr:DUF1080 domain-containing protein [Puteibacter caeruleilacunae]
MSKILLILFFLSPSIIALKAQEPLFKFGKQMTCAELISASKVNQSEIKWFQVSTKPDTWRMEDDELVCRGEPHGLIRTETKYKNFVIHLEWKHTEMGGNSGLYLWCDFNDKDNWPNAIQAQILEVDYGLKHNITDEGEAMARVHGEIFSIGEQTSMVPDNPRGERSKPVENRCLKRGNWNTYDIVCVDGVIKLAANGKFVNGVSQSNRKEGYICLESEHAKIHFRNLKIFELPD